MFQEQNSRVEDIELGFEFYVLLAIWNIGCSVLWSV